MEKHAIIKLINYKDANIDKAKKVSDYIQSPERTAPAYVFGHGLDVADVYKSLETIESRWKSKGSRMFKHGALSFGQPDLTPEKAVEVTKKFMEYFKDYPWMAAVHTNCPHRLHSHFLLCCINLRTGRKYSQGTKELQLFKDFYGDVASRHGLPVPKNWRGQIHIQKRSKKPFVVVGTDEPIAEPPNYIGNGCLPQPTPSQPCMPSYPQQNKPRVDLPHEIMDWYNTDFQRYFLLGVMNK